MRKHYLFPVLLFLLSAVLGGSIFYNYEEFSGRFQDGIKIQADGADIDINLGCLVPVVADWNNDGKKDLILGQFDNGMIRLYLNRGTDSAPLFKDYVFLKEGNSEISLSYG